VVRAACDDSPFFVGIGSQKYWETLKNIVIKFKKYIEKYLFVILSIKFY